MIQKIMLEENNVAASVEESIEQSKKIANVINHLIQKENVLMISQDAKIKNERYLCLKVNLDL
jgi:glucosamine 6-phosphate synthetase-like amidotransferase/phosphosugar isomerase protein